MLPPLTGHIKCYRQEDESKHGVILPSALISILQLGDLPSRRIIFFKRNLTWIFVAFRTNTWGEESLGLSESQKPSPTTTNAIYPLSASTCYKRFLPLAASTRRLLCDPTAPVQPLLTAASVTRTDQARFFTPTGPAAKGDTRYFKLSACANLAGF